MKTVKPRSKEQGAGSKAAKACDHKFVDSRCCLKCGWEPLAIPDEVFNEVERLINCSLHELVFVSKFAEDNQCEDGAQAVQPNLDRVAELMAPYDPSNERGDK